MVTIFNLSASSNVKDQKIGPNVSLTSWAVQWLIDDNTGNHLVEHGSPNPQAIDVPEVVFQTGVLQFVEGPTTLVVETISADVEVPEETLLKVDDLFVCGSELDAGAAGCVK